jgi:hypothetical protein
LVKVTTRIAAFTDAVAYRYTINWFENWGPWVPVPTLLPPFLSYFKIYFKIW